MHLNSIHLILAYHDVDDEDDEDKKEGDPGQTLKGEFQTKVEPLASNFLASYQPKCDHSIIIEGVIILPPPR